jgi:hypothetical protein
LRAASRRCPGDTRLPRYAYLSHEQGLRGAPRRIDRHELTLAARASHHRDRPSMRAALTLSVERAAQALVEALQLPACVQVTINLHEGRVVSIEPRLKLQRVHPDNRTAPRRPTSQPKVATAPS